MHGRSFVWPRYRERRSAAKRAVRICSVALAAALIPALLCACVALGSAPNRARANSRTGARATPTQAPSAQSNTRAKVSNTAFGCLDGPPQPQVNPVYSGQYSGAPGTPPREVALTFDDGPTPSTTPPILSVLESTRTPATFFDVGRYVHAWPYLAQREWDDGFVVGVHTWDHPVMTTLSPDRMRREIADTVGALHSAIGDGACIWLWRPPYGAYNRTVLQQARAQGLTTIMWNVDPRDWSRPGASVIVQQVLAQVRPGAIILMHDGPAAREQTAQALPIIIDALRARGLTPVSIPQLLVDGHYPGVTSHVAQSSTSGCNVLCRAREVLPPASSFATPAHEQQAVGPRRRES